MVSELSLEEWLKTVPEKVRSDPLWGSTYYRMAMYLYELAWKDCELLQKDFRGREIVHPPATARTSRNVDCSNF